MTDNMIAIDTLSIYDRLKNTQNTDSLFHEIAEIFKEFTKDKLTTKSDIETTRLMFQTDLENTESRLQS
ncbi:MAG: hypothetical protein OEV66_07040 [Spirochaetia bacterium]|nr:hypothetical protein [Spirochaetia bacterium]